MIGMQQQLRRIAKGRISRPPFGIGMTVRRNNRQPCHGAIKPPRNRARVSLRRKQTVGVKFQGVRHNVLA
jgi:hypothetical protein